MVCAAVAFGAGAQEPPGGRDAAEAQAPRQAPVKRILLAGDSWAASISSENRSGFPAPDVFEQVLADNGLGACEVQAKRTAWGGTKAADWVKPERLAEITGELEAHPTIDIVHLIIGGNDFLDTVLKRDLRELTDEERHAIWARIQKDIQTIVDACLAIRPDIRVVIADYVYLDAQAAEAFWDHMDFKGVAPIELNTWFVELGRKKAEIALRTERCEYVENWGTLQYWFGEPPKACPYPSGPYDPKTYPAGDITRPMPPGISPDGIHPNAEAHARILQNAVDRFYKRWLGGAG